MLQASYALRSTGAMISYKVKEAPATLVVLDPNNSSSWLDYSVQELEYNLVATIRQLVAPRTAKLPYGWTW